MPNVVTHGLMALDVYNQLDESRVKSAIQKFPKSFLLGSNGPDILFYYNVFPWQNQKENQIVANYGHAVHTTNINEFYNVAIEFIQGINDQQRQEILISYLAGHLQHWALDSLAHPFVFYRSGELKGATRYDHYRYESMIDALMVMYVKKRNLQDLHAKRFVDVSEEERRIIASFYQRILQKVFNISTDQQIIDSAILSFKQVLGFLYDPYHVKFPIIRAYEKGVGNEWAFTSHIVSSRIDAEFDVLNLKHETWANPTDKKEVSTQSFVDLYNESIQVGIEGVSVLNKILSGECHNFDSYLKGKCYDTGRPEGVGMKYFDSIYLKK